MANSLITKPEKKKTMLYWNTPILVNSDTRLPSLPLDSFLPFYRIGFVHVVERLKNQYAVGEHDVCYNFFSTIKIAMLCA